MIGMLSDIGLVRKLNEDYLGSVEDDKKRLYVVADGMGGHNAGEIASKIAVESTIEYVNTQAEFDDLGNILSNAIKFANNKIYQHALSDSNTAGMGTTITACLIYNGKTIIANVGDSSCFVIKEDGITKVTKDHSFVQQLLDNGTITEEKARNHPNKNIITRSLGTNELVEVDLFDVDLTNVIKCILCTDGLTNDVTYAEMYDIIMENDNVSSCEMLVNLSKSKGGRDNISVIVFEGECRDDRNPIRE